MNRYPQCGKFRDPGITGGHICLPDIPASAPSETYRVCDHIPTPDYPADSFAKEPASCDHDTRDGYCSKCNGLIVLGALQTYSREELAQAKDYAKRMSDTLKGTSEIVSIEPVATEVLTRADARNMLESLESIHEKLTYYLRDIGHVIERFKKYKEEK